MQGTDYSVDDRQLTLSKAIPANSLLKIYRETTTETIVSWNDASVLRAKDMSIQEVQLLHLAEETADKVFDSGMSTSPTNPNVWDGQYKRITDLLDPQEDGDAVTLRYVNDKQHGLITAIKNEGANQNASIVSTGETQNSRLTNTGNSYVSTMTTLNADTTTNANEAKNSASSASSSASTATTKATEASNSAELAKKWAMSSKTWGNEAKNSATSASSSASTATTKANEASNSASAAAKSAENAKTWDPSNYYNKTEVDNKISTANAVEVIPVTINDDYAYGVDVIKSGHIVHVCFRIKKVLGNVDSSQAPAIASGLPPNITNSIFDVSIPFSSGQIVRLIINTAGELKEHWALPYTSSQGSECEGTVTYICQ